jgi:glycerol-3-phosphate dehydrogenase
MEMPYSEPNSRVRVLILGGGIHGVGVAHDLASRGWRDVLVVEKDDIGSGTSSRSTKLIHGGLRYLEHARDFPLVAEGLRERRLLMELVPDIVKPLPLVFPVLSKGGVNRYVIKAGLTLYDMLAGKQKVGNHYSLSSREVQEQLPNLDLSLFKHFYVFFDGQTDDLALVQRIAKSASDLGVKIQERWRATKITPVTDGYHVHMTDSTGVEKIISTKYIVNAMGPWAHEIFVNSGITPKYEGINNKGAHLILKDIGLKMGVFLQSPEDGRIFFVLPWKGLTLIGTTESPFETLADSLKTEESDVTYLLEHTNRYFSKKFTKDDIVAKFSGLRWLAKEDNENLSSTSRSHVVSTHVHGTGKIYTIYGGKLTAYRALSEEIGDLIAASYGDSTPSHTREAKFWSKQSYGFLTPVPQRFINQ